MKYAVERMWAMSKVSDIWTNARKQRLICSGEVSPQVVGRLRSAVKSA